MNRRPSRLMAAARAIVGIRPATAVVADLATARETLAAREDDVHAATRGYAASLDEGRDAALAARARLTEVEVDRDVARRAVERLEAEQVEAEAAERRADVERLVGEAGKLAVEYRADVESGLAEMAQIARRLARKWAHTEIARAAANAALEAAGEAPSVPSAEAFRVWPGRAREQVGLAHERTLWVNDAGQPPRDELHERIREQPDGSGVLLFNGRQTFTHRRAFRTETFLEAERFREPNALVQMLRVPGLTPLDRDGWAPVDRADPQAVLRRLDELEKPSELHEDRRKPVTETKPLGPAVEVYRAPAPFRETSVPA